jgi:hypothetical protein
MTKGIDVPSELFAAKAREWGGAPAIFDMGTGGAPVGAVETAMLDIAGAQVGKHLGLPTHAYLVASDSKLVDAQAGMLDSLACHSVEKVVIDAEVIASAQTPCWNRGAHWEAGGEHVCTDRVTRGLSEAEGDACSGLNSTLRRSSIAAPARKLRTGLCVIPSVAPAHASTNWSLPICALPSRLKCNGICLPSPPEKPSGQGSSTYLVFNKLQKRAFSIRTRREMKTQDPAASAGARPRKAVCGCVRKAQPFKASHPSRLPGC